MLNQIVHCSSYFGDAGGVNVTVNVRDSPGCTSCPSSPEIVVLQSCGVGELNPALVTRIATDSPFVNWNSCVTGAAPKVVFGKSNVFALGGVGLGVPVGGAFTIAGCGAAAALALSAVARIAGVVPDVMRGPPRFVDSALTASRWP